MAKKTAKTKKVNAPPKKTPSKVKATPKKTASKKNAKEAVLKKPAVKKVITDAFNAIKDWLVSSALNFAEFLGLTPDIKFNNTVKW